jgi:tetratricopeptide (TPR) repeat protein
VSRHFTIAALFLLSHILISCAARQQPPVPPDQPVEPAIEPAVALEKPCLPSPGKHAVFSIVIDGTDAGREVYSDIEIDGPLGRERLISTHSVTRKKIGRVQFDTYAVKVQRTLRDSGLLLRGSHLFIDQLNVRTSLVGFNGESWDRQISTRSSVTESVKSDPKTLVLDENVQIGFRLTDLLRKVALGNGDAPVPTLYYEPLLEKQIEINISQPIAASTNVQGLELEGFWVEARHVGSDKVVLRAFFDTGGTLWSEEYPELHEVRKRLPGPLSLTSDTSELLVGLNSDAYIPNPNRATRATYVLRSTADRLDALDLLAVPKNHKIERQSPDRLLLQVEAGAPDKTMAPVDADLGASLYIQPNSPEVIKALRYLRSAGKRGYLPKIRRYNATQVIAQSSLLPNPKRFWSDPDQSAGLIMYYVSALLPDKHHTFSMADSLTTLDRGAGDCTEHAVLFASLMRAHKIPTRLIAGMILTRGGMWGYHMWNEYWNGSTWKPIDPSTMTYRPGALYVALGHGASQFLDVRDRLADFMWRTFSGVSFDLVEAADNGEILSLARPRNPDQNLQETALFNAVVLSQRGDHDGAIKLLKNAIPSSGRSLNIKLRIMALLVRAGHHNDALSQIEALRKETSAPDNLAMLDTYEFRCLLSMNRRDRAETVYERIRKRYENDPLSLTLIEAEYRFEGGDSKKAIALLEKALLEKPSETTLLGAFSKFVVTAKHQPEKEMIGHALEAARQAARQTNFADPQILATLARALLISNQHIAAAWMVDHALVLAPSDRTLHDLRATIPVVDKCVD